VSGVPRPARPRFSAGCAIFRGAGTARRWLLLRAYNYWDFPKGEVEPGEEPFAAAVREVEEETTLLDLRFPLGQSFHETPPYAGGKVARYYLAEAPAGDVSLPVSAALGRPEHQEFRWVEVAQARDLVGPRVREVVDWAERQLRDAPSREQQG
jgi:8-oxo-dGTP pyrophosphatase MutT (NUDIX family)